MKRIFESGYNIDNMSVLQNDTYKKEIPYAVAAFLSLCLEKGERSF